MKKILFFIAASALIVPIALFGCKGKVEKQQEAGLEGTEPPVAEEFQSAALQEPSQTVATETIPPTASLDTTGTSTAVPQAGVEDRAMKIQGALKTAGFYTGAIDGKIGPNTIRAIKEFQSAKGLAVDGKVGPRTWAELEKYLNR